MGAYSMLNTLRCLAGADVSIKDWDNHKKGIVKDCGKIRKLEAQDVALLLAFAGMQYDEGYGGVWKREDCYSYGSEEMFGSIVRLKDYKCKESRAFLLKAGLISYAAKDDCYDRWHENIVEHKNVYRLNVDKLLSLPKLDGRWGVLGKPTWVATHTEGGCRATPNSISNNKKNSSTGAAAAASGADDERAKVYLRYISEKLGFAEFPDFKIDFKNVVNVTAGKDPEAVIDAIGEFANDNRIGKKQKRDSLIGSVINRLKKIKKSDNPDTLPTADELAAKYGFSESGFSQPERIEAVLAPGDAQISETWDKFCKKMNLADLKEDDVTDIKNRFYGIFGKYKNRPTALAADYSSLIRNIGEPPEDLNERIAAIDKGMKLFEVGG